MAAATLDHSARSGRRRSVWRWVVVVLTGAAAVLWWMHQSAEQSFDRSLWDQAAAKRQFGGRFPMIHDVGRRIDAGDMPDHAAVLAALGRPDSGDASGTFPARWLYDLGPEHSGLFRVDDDWLEITFDRNGKLESHRVVTD